MCRFSILRMRVCSSINLSVLMVMSPLKIKHSRSQIKCPGLLKRLATGSPLSFLIECLDSILPSVTDLFNYSLASGIFPQCFKLVLSNVYSYIISHNHYNTCQSAYRPGHSTETAVLKVVYDLFLSLNKDNILY